MLAHATVDKLTALRRLPALAEAFQRQTVNRSPGESGRPALPGFSCPIKRGITMPANPPLKNALVGPEARGLPPVLAGHATPEIRERVKHFYGGVAEIFQRWVTRRASWHTQRAYRSDVLSFVAAMGWTWPADAPRLLTASIADVQRWRDQMAPPLPLLPPLAPLHHRDPPPRGRRGHPQGPGAPRPPECHHHPDLRQTPPHPARERLARRADLNGPPSPGQACPGGKPATNRSALSTSIQLPSIDAPPGIHETRRLNRGTKRSATSQK